MEQGGKRFKINEPKVVYENYDDEIVLINLENGNYYNITGVASLIWGLAEKKASLDNIINAVLLKYKGEKDAVMTSIREFLGSLQKEGLIVPMDGEDVAEESAIIDSVEESASPKLPFEAPVLNSYTDMQDLILLDPVHEVDETGWPNVRKEKKEGEGEE